MFPEAQGAEGRGQGRNFLLRGEMLECFPQGLVTHEQWSHRGRWYR